MPICIECRYPVSQLYRVLQSRNNQKPTAPPSSTPSHKSSASSLANHTSPAKAPPVSHRGLPPSGEAKRTNTVSSDVRLTQCPRCKRFADKYVEHDYVVIFIDLVLVKPQVYRHILFNRFSHDAEAIDPSIRRLGTLLLLFDVYLTMNHIESRPQSSSPIFHLNVFAQWGFFLLVCGAGTFLQHLLIRYLASFVGYCSNSSSHGKGQERQEGGGVGVPVVPTPLASGAATPTTTMGAAAPEPPRSPTPSSISTALFMSSCMTLFPILMIVWKPDEAGEMGAAVPSSGISVLPKFLLSPGSGVGWVRSGVAWAVILQNLEALRILLGCGFLGAGVLVLIGATVREFTRDVILGLAGLNER